MRRDQLGIAELALRGTRRSASRAALFAGAAGVGIVEVRVDLGHVDEAGRAVGRAEAA